MSDELTPKINRDILRKNFLKYTRKAFHLIPKINHPHILDVGCGAGIQTLELAELSKGKITAIDINETELQKLRDQIKKMELSARIRVNNCSFQGMDFPEESFDILWAEGIGEFITVESCLKDWKRFLKRGGCLVWHDDAKRLSNKLNVSSQYGFVTIGHFFLPEDAWWREYYEPMENQLDSLRQKHQQSPDAQKLLNIHQKEINSFKKNPQCSGFVLFQKQ